MEINIVDTLRSSFTMIILLACSVVALTFIFERWLFYKHTSIDADRFFMKIRKGQFPSATVLYPLWLLLSNPDWKSQKKMYRLPLK